MEILVENPIVLCLQYIGMVIMVLVSVSCNVHKIKTGVLQFTIKISFYRQTLYQQIEEL